MLFKKIIFLGILFVCVKSSVVFGIVREPYWQMLCTFKSEVPKDRTLYYLNNDGKSPPVTFERVNDLSIPLSIDIEKQIATINLLSVNVQHFNEGLFLTQISFICLENAQELRGQLKPLLEEWQSQPRYNRNSFDHYLYPLNISAIPESQKGVFSGCGRRPFKQIGNWFSSSSTQCFFPKKTP